MASIAVPDFHIWVLINQTACTVLNSMPAAQTVQLHPVIDTFVKNIAKVIRLAVFPVSAYAAGKRFQMAEIAALIKVTEKPFADNPLREVPQEAAELRDAMLNGTVESPVSLVLDQANSPHFGEEVS
jgi:hypothetical protein